MSYLDAASGSIVSRASGTERAAFIRRTFAHLAGSIGVFALVEAYLQSLGWGAAVMSFLSKSSWLWLGVMFAFGAVSMIADKWARDDYSKTFCARCSRKCRCNYSRLGSWLISGCFNHA